LNLGISGYYRWRARSEEMIPRSAETGPLKLTRATFAIPGMLLLLTYVIYPPLVAWSSLAVPLWARWLGVLVGSSATPLNLWVLSSLGKNVSETVLTKTNHKLITGGPYRWVRHPLYASSFTLLSGLSLVAANWLMAVLTVGAVALFSVVIIPLEENELLKKFGDRYRDYQRTTGCLLPRT
ncbi:MAG: isoprenylcysteine carboxylmethyltransferase family protein, partial [Acidobacteriota bacterium]|nr:isoprenylcysteine carboxylmethyltransferase family protein [Acidobacteriota bacterium]